MEEFNIHQTSRVTLAEAFTKISSNEAVNIEQFAQTYVITVLLRFQLPFSGHPANVLLNKSGLGWGGWGLQIYYRDVRRYNGSILGYTIILIDSHIN